MSLLNEFTRVLFAGGEGSAELAERAALPVLQRRTGVGEGSHRAHSRRGLLHGRSGYQAVRPRPAETAASRQRVGGRRSRDRSRQGLRRRRRRQRSR